MRCSWLIRALGVTLLFSWVTLVVLWSWPHPVQATPPRDHEHAAAIPTTAEPWALPANAGPSGRTIRRDGDWTVSESSTRSRRDDNESLAARGRPAAGASPVTDALLARAPVARSAALNPKLVTLSLPRHQPPRAVEAEAPLLETGDAADADEAASASDEVLESAKPRDPSPLHAGATDDNADLDKFQAYLAKALPNCQDCHRLDVSAAQRIRVVDKDSTSVPGLRVSIVDGGAGAVVWSGYTYGDGIVPFFPKLTVPGRRLPLAQNSVPEDGWIVQVSHDPSVDPNGQTAVVWDPAKDGDELQVVVPYTWIRPAAVPVDVAFIIDATGSMADEIHQIQDSLLAVTSKLRTEQALDLRYGAVAYRDLGDAFVTRRHPFTSDVEAFDRAMRQVKADSGGDHPESMNEALVTAVGTLDWRPEAASIAFLVADAPPHMDYGETATYAHASIAALHRAIRINTIAASGLDDKGTLVMRQVAQLTRGKFIFIEYGPSSVATAVTMQKHGVQGAVESNNLDTIIFNEVRSSVASWGKRWWPSKQAAW